MIKKSNTAPQTGSSASAPHGQGEGAPERRSWFYEIASLAIGALIAVVPAGIGLTTFLDPWRRQPSIPKSRQGAQNSDGKQGFTRVASLSALTLGSAPQRFPVIADQRDAWNYSANQPIGAVFLQQVGPQEVLCFNATCPHAGCSVSCNGQAFVCPCHNSSFQLDGHRRVADSGRENPSPRDLDGLEVDADKLAQGEIWVRFQNFYTGKHEKIAKA